MEKNLSTQNLHRNTKRYDYLDAGTPLFVGSSNHKHKTKSICSNYFKITMLSKVGNFYYANSTHKQL